MWLSYARGRGSRCFCTLDEVIDLDELDEGLRVVSAHGSAPDLVADHVLMATGHSTNRPECSPVRARWWSFARKHRAVFVPAAYPLEENLNEEVVSTVHTVGCVGMGLTAIDLILYLSEGRGGRFIRESPAGCATHRPGRNRD